MVFVEEVDSLVGGEGVGVMGVAWLGVVDLFETASGLGVGWFMHVGHDLLVRVAVQFFLDFKHYQKFEIFRKYT